MKKILIVCVLLFLPLSAWGVTIQVHPGLSVEVSLPGERWQISRQAPEFLVRELAEHATDGMRAKARKAGIDDPQEMARRMLSANEFYVFNPETRACLLVDFSPLKAGEEPPSNRVVKKSVQFAGESLSGEEGYSNVQTRTGKTAIRGAETAHRLDARFVKHGEEVRFVGIVGFAEPCWFFLYFTDPLEDERDWTEMAGILETLRVKKQNGTL